MPSCRSSAYTGRRLFGYDVWEGESAAGAAVFGRGRTELRRGRRVERGGLQDPLTFWVGRSDFNKIGRPAVLLRIFLA